MTPEPGTEIEFLTQAHDGRFAGLIGLRFVAASKDEVIAELTVTQQHTTPDGGVHGGVLMAIADIAGAGCARLNVPEGCRTSTFQSASNMMGSVKPGAVIRAVAHPVHLGSKTMVMLTRVYDAETGRLLCQTSQTQMTLDIVSGR